MHRHWPDTQLRTSMAFGRRAQPHVFLMLLPGAGLLCIWAHAAPPAGAQSAVVIAAAAVPASQPSKETCASCHEEVAKSFLSNPHGNADLSCASCHSGHTNQSDAGGRSEKSAFADTGNSILICTKCHAEMAGPFVYKHAAIKAEGCTGCHAAHGSQNAKLLNAPNTNELCKQCHSPATESATHGTNAGTPQAAQPCTNCHTHIHGSNMNAAFLN